MGPGESHHLLCVTSLEHWNSMLKLAIAITAFTFMASGSASVAADIPSPRLVSPSIMAKAENVNHCEESGDWHVDGPVYFGGLGWLDATWQRFRAPSFPRSMALATPQQQAWAMAHFVGSELDGWWPDQAGCTGGY